MDRRRGTRSRRAWWQDLIQRAAGCLAKVKESHTAHYLFGHSQIARQPIRAAQGQLRLEGLRHNNIHDLTVDIPLGVLTSVTGISGSGKSSFVGQLLVELVARLSRTQRAAAVG